MRPVRGNYLNKQDWMVDMAIYCNEQISNLEEYINELKCDAGRYWQYCDFTQEKINKAKTEIDKYKLTLQS